MNRCNKNNENVSGRAIYFVTLILSLIKFSPVLITARPLRQSRRKGIYFEKVKLSKWIRSNFPPDRSVKAPNQLKPRPSFPFLIIGRRSTRWPAVKFVTGSGRRTFRESVKYTAESDSFPSYLHIF